MKNISINVSILAILILTCAVLIMWQLPLFSITETRYAEFSRKMVEYNNFLVPLFSSDEPFYGKPFLPFLLDAAFIKVFGNTNIAPRLPSFIEGFFIIYLLHKVFLAEYVKPIKPIASFTTILAISVSTAMFLMNSTSVVVDNMFLLAITLVFSAFWLGFVHHQRLYSYLFFLGLAMGFLTKGFAVLAYTAPAIFVWCLMSRNLLAFFRTFPVITGTILFLCLVAPWFIYMELHYPGYVEYFIIDENLARFTGTGGEIKANYGFYHKQPYGMASVYAFLIFLPWSLFLLYALARKYSGKSSLSVLKSSFRNAGFSSYLITFLVVNLIFFSISRIYLPIQLIFVFPSVCLIIASFVIGRFEKVLISILAVIASILLMATILLFVDKDRLIYLIESKGTNHHKVIIDWLDQHKNELQEHSIPTYYIGQDPFGSEYYSDGRVKFLFRKKDFLKLEPPFYVINRKKNISQDFLKKFICTLEQEFRAHKVYKCES